jgi:hypothetical protein
MLVVTLHFNPPLFPKVILQSAISQCEHDLATVKTQREISLDVKQCSFPTHIATSISADRITAPLF